MSDLRMNSIFGAVLASVLGVMGVGVLADALVHPNYPDKAGYLPEVVLETPAGGVAAPSGPPDFGLLFADAAQLQELIARGQRVSAQCTACHTFEAGGPNRIGPNLHDALGRQVASHAGYDFSEAMRARGGAWDYLALNDYLLSPARDVPGTKMAFAGLRNEQDRVAMIAYLRSLSPNNVPLPAPLPAPAPTETAEDAETPEGAEPVTTPAPAASGGG
ncbi:MAG: cytochrome c family protein [Phycisphaerales bacterium]|nr:cytochrome c family protein [Hyphomonadaceae bacterium]